MIRNPKYKPNKKNGGKPPAVTNQGTLMIPVPCGNCMECRKQKTNNWRIRLLEEIRTEKRGKFVTMTFSDKSLIELEEKVNKNQEEPLTGYKLENEIVTEAVKLFRERHRKKYKKSIKHWLVTELGQHSTERIHIHGILYTDIGKAEIEKLWKYGNVNKRDKTWNDSYCTERTVNYIVKYINKTDKKHKAYIPVILTSPGIGKGYIKRLDAEINKYNGKETKEYYTTRNGYKIGLPTYYRNKLYTDQEKEQLWINKLESTDKWINGIKVDKTNSEEVESMLEYARQQNTKLGYGGIITQEQKDHENYKREKHNERRHKQFEAERNTDESDMEERRKAEEVYRGKLQEIKNSFESQRGC